MKRTILFAVIVVGTLLDSIPGKLDATESGLVGHWKLQGDCQDYSGSGNHGVNHGVDLSNGKFDGVAAYIKIPNSKSLHFGTNDFTICAWIYTDVELDDIVGDVFEMYDPSLRKGFTLTINSSAGGYQSQGTDRHVHFGIDNAQLSDWQDCGRPNAGSNYVSNSLTVYKGHLYAATTDAHDEQDWRHVYRYEGGDAWADCGQVGDSRATGVMPLIVHNGDLYAATGTYDWTRIDDPSLDPGRVYRYRGETTWEDLGSPSDNRTLTSLASYKGKLFAGGVPNTWGVFVHNGGTNWTVSKLFPTEGPQECKPHAMCRHNGKLYVAYPGIYAYDGASWKFIGEPLPADQNWFLQTHSLTLYRGQLLAGTWPEAKVSAYEDDQKWRVIGRVGRDGTEVNSLVVYNGKLYGGSLPRSEVCRFDNAPEWTSLKRFYSPEGWRPGLPGQASRKEYNLWSRVTSLTVCDGKLFASIGSCTSSVKDAPLDVRGKVFSMEAGKVASFDDDIGPGWKHLLATRDGGRLKIYLNGRLVAQSSSFDPAQYDLSTDQPMRIGAGQSDYFAGRMKEVRVYNRALSAAEINNVSAN